MVDALTEVRTSRQTSQALRPLSARMTLRMPPTRHHPRGVPPARAFSTGPGNGEQRSWPDRQATFPRERAIGLML